MKWLIASDIHGSAYYCDMLLQRFDAEKADRLLLLGDILYHGPRNDLPKGYEPKKVIEMLNAIKERILCVRGNCDTEVDQMVLHFPILANYASLAYESRLIYLTHGHRFNPDNPLPLQENDILLFGHTHIPLYLEKDGLTFMNPGSVALPKEESWNGYMTMQDNLFCWKNLFGDVKMEYCL